MILQASLIVDIVAVYIQKSHLNKTNNDCSVVAIIDTINIYYGIVNLLHTKNNALMKFY
jgi:hypothetical protein